MNIDRIKHYNLYIDDEKYELPYAVIRQKVIRFKTTKYLNKLVKFYKQKDIGYKADRKSKIVYRTLFFENIPFDERKRIIKVFLNIGYEDFCSDERNWLKPKTKQTLSCMANYLLKGFENEAHTLTSRQIRYVKEKEVEVNFIKWEEGVTETDNSEYE